MTRPVWRKARLACIACSHHHLCIPSLLALAAMRPALLLTAAAAAAIGTHAWADAPAQTPQLALSLPYSLSSARKLSSMTDPLGLPLYIFHHAAQQSTPRADPLHEPSPSQLRAHARDFLRTPNLHQPAPPPGCEITFVDNVRLPGHSRRLADTVHFSFPGTVHGSQASETTGK